jgi:hypothetical protein
MSHPRYFELSWPPRPHFLNFVGAKSKSLGSGNHMAHVYLVLASMSDPRYFVLGWPPGSRTLDLVGALGMTSMSDPRLLSLASMSDSHLLGPGWPPSSSALSLATCQIHVTWVWQSCLIHLFFFFCNGQHDFLESERGGREKTSIRAPLWAASAHAPHHCVCSGEAHRMSPRNATLSSVLEEHTPPKWRRQRLPASTCLTRVRHFWI